ncbi:MAG TPA: sulfatase-like hydrolase/transferase [Pyrinomonadaceae bacterium]|nr:sulfatase-like hydrolase/transferase [Pyrinomonadaceae bacterium]
MKLTRRTFVKTAAAGASLLLGQSFDKTAARPRRPRPNIIFILADDLGWGDLSCYGRPDYRTPNLDLMATQGTKFTDAYSASAVCTPTRCGFITGRYPARLKIGLTEPLPASNHLVGLDPGHPTIASLLKQSGYDTALFGKWHLGFRPEWGPNAHGFDEFFGILAGAGDYFLHKNGLGQADLYQNLTPVEQNGYLTEMLTERAVNYVVRHARNTRGGAAPFYLSLHYTAPHWPWQGPKGGESVNFSDKTIEPVTMGGGGSIKLYAEMMRSLDDGVGRVMQALKRSGLDRNTLVIFTSDNGGERFSYQWPFSGQKGELLEGGIRVPAIIRWPGVAPANRVTHQMAITMDWTATILAAAETSAADGYPLDGIDLLPLIRDSDGSYKGLDTARDRTFYWRMRTQDAVREGKWKYVRIGDSRHLFDLSIDQREQADFSKKHPAILDRLSSSFTRWSSQMLPRPGE